MIHKIKGLYDDGQGASIRAISQELGISRNTVRRYLRQDEASIDAGQRNRCRHKKLDAHRDYIVHLLGTYPKLTSVKIARKLQAKVGPLNVSDRSLRRYVRQLKATVVVGQPRYYQPVLDMVPGVQCQVDPGELRDVMIGGEPRTVHFVVFVLSYSRLMYVGVRFKPLDTAAFIQLHDEAFRYFGGTPEECVYDQTKMVVISEQFRELDINQQFYRYATTAGFQVQACRGYDPESKGKVEAGVKYVKQDALYGDAFRDEAELHAHIRHWLDTVANVRLHGTTGQLPRTLFKAEEEAHLRSYLRPACAVDDSGDLARRKVDKTGLISWQANKYSVPMVYQRGAVGVQVDDAVLSVCDLETGEVIATHQLSHGKGRVIRNTDHYRDPRQDIQALEQAIEQRLGQALGQQFCCQLRASMPRHYKDQLAGAKRLFDAESELDLAQLDEWAIRDGLTAGKLKQWLTAAQMAKARGRDADSDDPALHRSAAPLDLAAYAQLGRSSGQPEVTHGAA